MCASLFPAEAFMGYYLQYPSIDAMKESLMHLKTKFSPKMIMQAEGELRRVRDHPDTSLSSSAIEERTKQCELLLAKALHDNPDCAVEIPLEAGPTGWAVDITAWKTKGMRAEAKRIWEMGQSTAKILNDSSWTFLFLRRLLDFLSPLDSFGHHYCTHDCDKKRSEHTEVVHDSDDSYIQTILTIDYGKFAFAHGRIFSIIPPGVGSHSACLI